MSQVHLIADFTVKEEPPETLNNSELTVKLELRDGSNECNAKQVTAEHGLTRQHQTSSRKTHDQELFTCILCELQFEEAKYLRNHMVMGHGLVASEGIQEDTLVSGTKPKSDSHNLKEVQLISKPKTKCATKSKETISNAELFERIFPVNDSLHVSCSVCDMEFDNLSALELHSEMSHMYVCCYCERRFDGPEILKKHLSFHSATDDGLFACSGCGACFSEKRQLERHLRCAHGTGLDELVCSINSDISCSICSRTFQTISGLQRHERRHGKLRRSVCDVCDRSYANLTSHMRTHSKENVRMCDKCGLEFRSSGALKSHRRIHAAAVKLHGCPCCDKKYTRLSHVRSHLLTHSENLTCAECGIVCAESVEFKEHLLEHEAHGAAVQRRQCAECGAQLADEQMLEAHRAKFHDTDVHKPSAQCTQCGKTLFQECNLKRHAIACAKKRYQCPLCLQRFNSFNVLYRHGRRKHNETIQNNGPRSVVKCDMQNIANVTPKPYEESYECSICGIILSFLHNLKRHMWTHTGETPYQCEKCGKEFRDQGNLRRHSFVHSGEKRYECFHCGKRFTQSGTLKQHVAKQHQQPVPVGSLLSSGDAGHAATSAGGRLCRQKGQPRSRADITDVSLVAVDQLTSADILRLSDIVVENPDSTADNVHCGTR